MKAVILAAGMGTRMGELTRNKPKCMLEFMGNTLLGRQLTLFNQIGIDKPIVVTGYQAEEILYENCIKVRNEYYDSTNMVESLFCTRDLWDDDIIVSYGDIVYEKNILEKLVSAGHDISVVIDMNGKQYFQDRFGDNYLNEIESLTMDSQSHINDIGQPNPDESRIEGQYIGLMKFSKKGLTVISEVYDNDKQKYWDKPWLRSKNLRNGYMTDLLQRLIGLGYKVKGVPVESGWLEFDSAGDYEMYMKWIDRNTLNEYFNADS